MSYDMTVRNANGNIVQFLYGEDGMDAIKIESQPLYYITKSPEEMEKDYLLGIGDNLEGHLGRKDARQVHLGEELGGKDVRAFQAALRRP